MKHLRTLLIVGCTLALHVPMASAKFVSDFYPQSNVYNTPITQLHISFEVTGTGTMMTGSGRLISRGEFTTMLVDKLYSGAEMEHCFQDISTSSTYTLLFTDVPVDEPDASALCIAMRDGFIRGYSDGSFRPNQPITFDEAAKILSRAFVLAPYAESDMNSPWFMPYLKALSDRNAIPSSIKNIDQKITLAEGSELIDRINFGITWNPATSLSDLMQTWAPPMSSVPHAYPVPVKARTPLAESNNATDPNPSTSSSMSSAGSESSVPADVPWYRIF